MALFWGGKERCHCRGRQHTRSGTQQGAVGLGRGAAAPAWGAEGGKGSVS